jgi:hypothetical protein
MSNGEPINPWNYKPWWCQPWSILLTGTGLIAGSWWLGQRLWLTVLVAVPVLIWMGFFLLLWPGLVRKAWAELEPGEQKE